jgi:thymidylate kinase
MTVLIAVWGIAPGIGKSTLSDRLARWLTDAGLCVDHFREEEILTRPQFASVAAEFTRDGTVSLNALLATTAEFVGSALARADDVVIADALVPFVPTLLAMGHDEKAVAGFVSNLTEVLAPVNPVMIFLDGSAETALSRAARREGAEWLDWYVGKLARYGVSPPVTDVASAVRYLARERAVTLAAVDREGWDTVVIDRADELPEAEVLRTAQQSLDRWISGAARHR